MPHVLDDEKRHNFFREHCFLLIRPIVCWVTRLPPWVQSEVGGRVAALCCCPTFYFRYTSGIRCVSTPLCANVQQVEYFGLTEATRGWERGRDRGREVEMEGLSITKK